VIADQNGNPIAINAYDEWGIPNAANQGRFGYTGQAWLSELGMWYYKARLYSPTLGRFLQTDPVGYQDQVNLYAYVGNDPVVGRDPLGLAEANTCSRVGDMSCSGSYSGSLGDVSPVRGTPLTNPSGRTDEEVPVRTPGAPIKLASVGGSLPAFTRPSRDPILVDAAERAANSIPPWLNSIVGRTFFAWLRGSYIHTQFKLNVVAMGNPLYRAEVSYLRGVPVVYGTPGSVRADAVVGPIGHPLLAIELKTGGAYITRDEYNAYKANLPVGTLLQEIFIP
jgi:RHS repeat-associated protein